MAIIKSIVFSGIIGTTSAMQIPTTPLISNEEYNYKTGPGERFYFTGPTRCPADKQEVEALDRLGPGKGYEYVPIEGAPVNFLFPYEEQHVGEFCWILAIARNVAEESDFRPGWVECRNLLRDGRRKRLTGPTGPIALGDKPHPTEGHVHYVDDALRDAFTYKGMPDFGREEHNLFQIEQTEYSELQQAVLCVEARFDNFEINANQALDELAQIKSKFEALQEKIGNRWNRIVLIEQMEALFTKFRTRTAILSRRSLPKAPTEFDGSSLLKCQTFGPDLRPINI